MSAADPSSTTLFYLAGGVIFCLGLFLLIYAFRGRQIDDHPWCRKCRFDLYGRDKDDARNCPECGNDLTFPKAIRIGQRRKRRGMAWIASLVILLGVSGLGIAGYTDVMGVDWQHHKPVWLLMREANQTPGAGTSDAALFELIRRYDTGLLKSEQIQDIVEDALIHQADALRPWQPAWGNFLQQARAGGEVSDDQWAHYFEGIMSNPHSLVVRSTVVSGSSTLSVKLQNREIRMADDGDILFWLQFRSSSITVGPLLKHKYKEQDIQGATRLSWNNSRSRTNHLKMSDEDWSELDVGKHMVVYEYEVALRAHVLKMGDPRSNLVTKKFRLEKPIEVLPAGSTTTKLLRDPAYRSLVEDAVKLGRISMRKITGNPNTHYITLYLSIEQRVFPVPGSPQSQKTIDLAFDIILRHEGKEYLLRSATCPGNSDVSGIQTGTIIDTDLSGKTVDIILRPSIQQAEASIDCYEIWGEEIIFKDVNVE